MSVSSGRGDSFPVKAGPTNLDVECKAALQKLLKPSNYPVIVPWISTARTDAKRDMVKLGQLAAAADAELSDQRTAFAATCEPVLVNRHGRARLAKAVPCTADRVQSDLLRNRHGTDQRDPALQAKRRFFQEYAPVPSCNSVDDFHRLRDVPLHSDESTRVLTEQARRNLQRWQVRGPERDREAAAQAMRSLRSISNAVGAMPSYQDHSRAQVPGGEGCANTLYDYAKVAPKGAKTFKPGYLKPSSSAPALLQPPKPFIEQEEIDNIARPGGCMVDLFDKAPLQMLKNRERGSQSKVSLAGGKRDWTTTYGSMALAL